MMISTVTSQDLRSDQANPAIPAESSVAQEKVLAQLVSDITEIATHPEGNYHINELKLQLLISEFASYELIKSLDLVVALQRHGLSSTALLQATPSSFEEAKSWIENISAPKREKKYLYNSLLRGLASHNVEFAMREAKKIPQKAERDTNLAAVIEVWARDEPRAVFDWLQNQEDAPFLATKTYLAEMKKQISRKPRIHRAFVEELPPSHVKTDLCELVGRYGARITPDEITTWMQKFEGEELEAVLRGLIDGWSIGKYGTEILDYLKENHRKADYYLLAFRAATLQLAFEQPIALIYHYEQLDEEEQMIITQLLPIPLATEQPERAILWARSLDEGKLKEEAIIRVAGALTSFHPEKSFDLSLDIKDPEERLRSLKGSFQIVCDNDSEAANKLLAKSTSLSSFERSELEEITSSSKDASTFEVDEHDKQ